MEIHHFTVGSLFTNCYLILCQKTKEAAIIDPGFDRQNEAEKILKTIQEHSLKMKYIINTHGHPDHTCGNNIVKQKFNTPILIHENDAPMLGEKSRITQFFGFTTPSPEADTLLHDGDTIQIGETILRVMHTPGHTQGSISLLGEKEVFTGDTLFMGSIGRTDFPESSNKAMQLSLKKLAHLPNHFIIYPGHGPTTTIGEEKATNPFLQQLQL